MSNMSMLEALKKTRDMWEWLAGNPEKDKKDYLNIKKIDDASTNNCYLCEYVVQNSGRGLDCDFCPLKGMWADTSAFYSLKCNESSAWYYEWSVAIKPKALTEYALKIAEACKKKIEQINEHNRSI